MKKVKIKETAYKWGKGAAVLGVSVGTGIIVKSMVKNNVPEDNSRIKDICISLGTFALTSYVSNKLTTHMDEKIESARKEFEDLLNIVAEFEDEEEVKEKTKTEDVQDSFNNMVDEIAKGTLNIVKEEKDEQQ